MFICFSSHLQFTCTRMAIILSRRLHRLICNRKIIITILSFSLGCCLLQSIRLTLQMNSMISPEASLLRDKGYIHMSVTVPPPYPPYFKHLEKKRFGHRFVYAHSAKGSVAELLHKDVKIFCSIDTDHTFHQSRARHVRATWAQHCNQFAFFSNKADPLLPAYNMRVETGRQHLWNKTKNWMRWMYKNVDLDKYDWYYRADDDTYAIIENMRLMLLSYSPKDLLFFGFVANAKKIEKRDFEFVASGAGFILSRSALRMIVENGIDNPDMCLQDDHVFDDQQLSECLRRLGVRLVDSRDFLRRHRFMAVPPDRVLVPVQMAKRDSNWVHYWSVYPVEQGPDCCSDFAIAFHYIYPEMLYQMEYLLYHLRPYGFYNRQNRQNYLANARKFSQQLMMKSEAKKVAHDASTTTIPYSYLE